jgi:hypothetical protein
MSGWLRRAMAKIDALAGVSFPQTYLYRISRPEGWSAITVNDRGIRWDVLLPEAVGQLCDIGPFDVGDGLQRLRRGDRCYTVSLDGRLAHYSWVQHTGSHPITEAGVSQPVGPDEFWIFHCRTAGWAKGRRLFPATLERIVSDHFAEGYKTAWIYTSCENIASQKGILRAGFAHVATLRSLRVGRHYYEVGQPDQDL